jgi:hypothetical protein
MRTVLSLVAIMSFLGLGRAEGQEIDDVKRLSRQNQILKAELKAAKLKIQQLERDLVQLQAGNKKVDAKVQVKTEREPVVKHVDPDRAGKKSSKLISDADASARNNEIHAKVNELIEESNKLMSPKLAEAMERLASKLGVPASAGHYAYIKAAGFCDKNLDGTKPVPVPDLLMQSEKDQLLICGKYACAERVIAWMKFDPELKFFFVDRTPRNPLDKVLFRTQLECAIDVLEYAKGQKVFAGIPYEIDPAANLAKLKSRYSELIAGPLK